MPARPQLKAFASGASFISKLAKTSLTNLTNNFCEAFLFDRALGFLPVPVGGMRLQETAGEEPPAVTGFVQMPVVWQKLTSTHMVFHLAASLQLLERSSLLRVEFLLLPCCWVMFPNLPAGPCLGDGAGAGRLAAACPFVHGFVVTQLRSDQIWYPSEF